LDITNVRYEGADWIILPEDSIQWQTVVNR